MIKKVYLGQAGASDFTHHKDEARKQGYIHRHKNNEHWSKSGVDTRYRRLLVSLVALE